MGKEIFLQTRRKTDKEKEGNNLEKDIIFLGWKRTEGETEKNIWRRKNYYHQPPRLEGGNALL